MSHCPYCLECTHYPKCQDCLTEPCGWFWDGRLRREDDGDPDEE